MVRTVASVAVAGLVLLSGCSSDSGGSSPGGGAADGSDEPVPGGELVYALEAETSGGWCLPEGQLAISGIMVARAIYDTLTVPNAEAEYVPFLAESVEPNEDYTVWTIELREGITFHDGTALDATVVKNNIDAFRGEYPPRQPLLLRFFFEPVESVEVLDDLTLEVTMDRPWVAFPAALYSEGRAGISAQAQLDDAETCDQNLIGTGPFEFEEWVQNDHLSVKRNPDYWRTDADGTPLPYLEQVVFRPIIDATTRSNAVVSGEVDATHTAGAAGTLILTDAAEAGQIQALTSAEYPEVGFQILNTGVAPFDNRDARLAAAHAFDREEFRRIRNQGLFEIASGPFGPGNMGYLEDAGFPEFDLDKAREHAAAYEAQTGEPLRFTYTYQADPETAQTAQLLQEQWARAGIEVAIEPIEQSALISTAISGDYQAISFRNHGGGDPDQQYIWWYGGSPLNFGRIADERIDSLLDEGRSEPDPQRREEIYQEVNRVFGAEAYSQWVSWVEWTIGSANDVRGLMGPALPDGSEPFGGLAAGHTLAGVWRNDG